MHQVKRQPVTSDRVARTIRATPELIETLDRLAEEAGISFNDVAISLLAQAVEARGSNENVDQMTSIASRLAGPILRQMEAGSAGLSFNARLLACRAIAKSAIDEACDRMLVPHQNSRVSFALWSIAKEIASELRLEGGAWDFVREHRLSSPPANASELEALSAAIVQLKKRHMSEEERDRVETLDAYLGLAQQEQQNEWADLKRQAQAELDEAMLALRPSREGDAGL